MKGRKERNNNNNEKMYNATITQFITCYIATDWMSQLTPPCSDNKWLLIQLLVYVCVRLYIRKCWFVVFHTLFHFQSTKSQFQPNATHYLPFIKLFPFFLCSSLSTTEKDGIDKHNIFTVVLLYYYYYKHNIVNHKQSA